MRQRNANWAKWIERRLAQPGTIMVAVGAGHLAGNDSVLAMLKKDGCQDPARAIVRLRNTESIHR